MRLSTYNGNFWLPVGRDPLARYEDGTGNLSPTMGIPVSRLHRFSAF